MPGMFASIARACVVVLAFVVAVGLPRATAFAEQPSEPTWKVFNEAEDPTPQPIVEAMLKLATVGQKDVVYDLGCGDGRIVITAAKRYGATGFGIDINPKMIARAKENAEKNNVVDKTTFIEGDLYKADLNSATVVTLFLWPTMNIRLRPRLLELAPGTRIVSHEHDMGAWRPDRVVNVNSHDRNWGARPLLLWIIPASIGGNWQLSVDGRVAELKLEQKYQRFSGSAVVDGRSHSIRNGRIRGAEVSFDLALGGGKSRRYTGHATLSHEIDGEGWQAKRKE